MIKCVYRDSDNMCCNSTSKQHCKTVTDKICKSCEMIQDKLIVSDAQKLRSVIRKAYDMIPTITENGKVIRLLYDSLKI